MSPITRFLNMIKLLIAFRQYGLLDAWLMAWHTNEIIRFTVARPYLTPEEDAYCTELETSGYKNPPDFVPYALLPAPKD